MLFYTKNELQLCFRKITILYESESMLNIVFRETSLLKQLLYIETPFEYCIAHIKSELK